MSTLNSNLRINGERLWNSLMEMAKIGPGIAGGNNRQTLTDEDSEGRALFQKWCESAGCTMGLDQMGNMFATRPGSDSNALPVYVGSHLDTQPTGGKYDGILGVLGGLEIINTLNDLNIQTKHPIVVTNWTNEEGTRFAPPMLASGVFGGIHTGGGEVKVFVDTAPVAEKPLGQAAGLGWQGKHTNLVSRTTGNWMFLGAIFTTLEMEPDAPEVDHCGSCRKCLDICPTEAFVAPYKMDARRCISYLTIEHKGPIDLALRPGLGNHIYGCDDCLAVCPWNKFAVVASDMRYAAQGDLAAPPLRDLVVLDDAGFRAKFAGSPIKRIGRDRFIRNVLYAIGNSGNPSYAPLVHPLVADADTSQAERESITSYSAPSISIFKTSITVWFNSEAMV